MQAGDLVILYSGHTSVSHIWLTPAAIVDNRFGHFHHDDFIGKPFGSRISSRGNSDGWVYALRPTVDLWASAQSTRTQIVDETDASIITFALDLQPGNVVVESGTGSGCMTLAMAKCVAPNGHVHTYEYNHSRVEAARDQFKKMDLTDIISVYHADVCGRQDSEGGFGSLSKHSVDAVFLDLPEPWTAIESSKHILKPGKGICCYSPCIEQVLETCVSLRKHNFISIRMVEVRRRALDAKFMQIESADVGRNDPKDANMESKDVKGENDEAEFPEATRPRKRMKLPKVPHSILCARPTTSMKGHTAFLTFAYSPIG